MTTRRLALLLAALAVTGAILRTLWREARALWEPVPAVRTWRVPNPYSPDTASGIDAVDVTFVAYGITRDEPGGGW